MSCPTQKQRFSLLITFLLVAHVAAAQPAVRQSEFATVEYQNYDKYYERITYIGKRKDHFIVNTYLKDSTLYRVDNYRVIDQVNNINLFAVRHGPTKILYNDGRLYLTCDYNMNVLNGPFIVYFNDGTVKRKELYRGGTLKKGLCYDTSGREKTCEAFYRQVQFMGNTGELKAYLEKNLTSALATSQSLMVNIRLIINEIGQVIEVKTDAGLTNPRVVAGIRKLVQDMPRWRENESNWQPAAMDGVAISGVWGIQAYRDRSAWRVNFP